MCARRAPLPEREIARSTSPRYDGVDNEALEQGCPRRKQRQTGRLAANMLVKGCVSVLDTDKRCFPACGVVLELRRGRRCLPSPTQHCGRSLDCRCSQLYRLVLPSLRHASTRHDAGRRRVRFSSMLGRCIWLGSRCQQRLNQGTLMVNGLLTSLLRQSSSHQVPVGSPTAVEDVRSPSVGPVEPAVAYVTHC